MLLALLGAGKLLEGVREALLGEFQASRYEALFVGFLRGQNDDHIIFCVRFVALCR